MVDIKERFIKLQLEQSPESEKYLRYLISKGLITMETMRNYCLTMQMDEYIKANQGHVGHALIDLSDDYGIGERQIQKIHKKCTRIF